MFDFYIQDRDLRVKTEVNVIYAFLCKDLHEGFPKAGVGQSSLRL